MASEVDIANLALSHLGDDAGLTSFDPADGSAQADHCAMFYPLARDAALEAHGWSFARRTAALQLRSELEVDGFAYGYALPADCLRPLRIYTPGARHDTSTQDIFDCEIAENGDPILLADTPDAKLIYVVKATDTSRYTPQFVNALSWALASMLAGPILKGDTGMKVGRDCWQVFASLVAEARLTDSRRSKVVSDHTPTWIGDR